MKKAIIIITTKDNKENRFIKCDKKRITDSNYHQEWEDGWKFEKGKKYALSRNSKTIEYFDDINALVSLITAENDTLVIWVNQYLVKDCDLKKDVTKLKEELTIKQFNVKIAQHNAPDDFEASQNYSLSTKTESHKFKKIITKNSSSEPILNASADFDDIEEVFFHPLEVQKKKIINLWLPLAIDIQGLSEVQSDTQKAEEYFNEIKNENEYLTSLLSFGKEEDFPHWQEIKEKIKNGYKDFDPTILVNHVSNIKDFSAFNTHYFSDPKFLPKWLQEVVTVLDSKIIGQTSAAQK